MGALLHIEHYQILVSTQIRQNWEDQDTRFLLQSEFYNLAAAKKAILWSIGWANDLFNEGVLAQYEKQ